MTSQALALAGSLALLWVLTRKRPRYWPRRVPRGLAERIEATTIPRVLDADEEAQTAVERLHEAMRWEGESNAR